MPDVALPATPQPQDRVDPAAQRLQLATPSPKQAQRARNPPSPPPSWPKPSKNSLDPLITSLEKLQHAAATELARREDAWRPHALALAEWLPKAQHAQNAAESLKNLKSAEKWLKGAADTLRNERFAPIAEETRRIWDQLRLQSNISLEDVHLGGSPLSLSMDPARVEGLARVLQAASKDRQVIVFTHDDRLPEAVRRRPYLAALALFDDMDRAADVMARINKEGGRPAGDTFKACNAGAHGKLDVVPIDLIRNTEKLARWMQGLQ